MKLYHFPFSPNSRKVVAVLHHLQIDCEYEFVDLSHGDQLKPEFLNLNPNHMIPTLVEDDFVLWESNAIMQYLCTKVPGNSLWPINNPRLQADISRWQFWQVGHFGRACGILLFERVIKKKFNRGETDNLEIAKGEELFHRFAQVLESHLKDKEWLVGKQVTLADFAVGSFQAMAEMADYPMANYPEIKRWYSNVENLPAWTSSALSS
jgi:glutathione S-transferase